MNKTRGNKEKDAGTGGRGDTERIFVEFHRVTMSSTLRFLTSSFPASPRLPVSASSSSLGI
ncbi:MAG: hypothetical protein RMY28_024980 [Nostoc sp. ChiSLP01]|nr:hypothetical protein [Nostoc sp. CmiSLP01]MDZ8282691.1 hypothetical protein [Nostoc sp. ChiSLP01]